MSRINNHVGIESADALLGSYGEDHIPGFGEPIRIYKFRKLSGIIRITPQGEQSLKTDPAFFTQVVNLYTSKEPVVVLWEGSTSIKLDEQDRIVKITNVGDYYDLFSNSSFTTETKLDDITFVNNEFTAQSVQKKIELSALNWLPTDSDISDYVYLILDKRAQSYQWLEIASVSPSYNAKTKVLENVYIDFDNIGIKYAASGKNILDFFQFGAIGEGYAFPKEEIIDDGEGNEIVTTTVDITYLNDIGISSLQYDFMCGAADSSYAFYGRQTGTINDEGDYIIDKSHRLFLHEELFPISSKIFFNQPNSNSFMYEGAEPTISGIWKSYKEQPNTNNAMGDYNVLQTKEVLTGFKMTRAEVLASNADVDKSLSRENWNNASFFAMKQAYDFTSVKGIKSVLANASGWANYSYTMFLNFNSYVNFSSDVFNFDYQETTKYKLTDTLGVLGGIINIVVGGLDIGWTKKETIAPKQPLNLRFPCISYLNGIAALNETAPLPCDVFLDDKAKQVIPVNTNIMTSHRFTLTDIILDASQIRAGAERGKGGGGYWYTKYIGQTEFEDGTLINADGSPFEWNPPTTTTITPDIGKKWVVDAIVPHVITNADVRLTAYKEIYNDKGKLEDISVYQSLFTTLSKSVNDIRLWGSVMKFNYYDQFNSTGGQAKWPEIAIPPPTPIDKSPIKLIGNFEEEKLTCSKIINRRSDTTTEEKKGLLLNFKHEVSAFYDDDAYTIYYDAAFGLNENFEYIGQTPIGANVESLLDLEYVYVNIQIIYNYNITTHELYAQIDNGGDLNEQFFTADKIKYNYSSNRPSVSKTTATGVGIFGAKTINTGEIYTFITSNYFRATTIRIIRNPIDKSVKVLWNTNSPNIMSDQVIYGYDNTVIYKFDTAASFETGSYDAKITNVLLIQKQ